MHERIAERLIQVAQERRTEMNECDTFTDWSRLLTEALRELQRAEDELRLIHANVTHLLKANHYVINAQLKLVDLTNWICKENSK